MFQYLATTKRHGYGDINDKIKLDHVVLYNYNWVKNVILLNVTQAMLCSMQLKMDRVWSVDY